MFLIIPILPPLLMQDWKIKQWGKQQKYHFTCCSLFSWSRAFSKVLSLLASGIVFLCQSAPFRSFRFLLSKVNTTQHLCEHGFDLSGNISSSSPYIRAAVLCRRGGDFSSLPVCVCFNKDEWCVCLPTETSVVPVWLELQYHAFSLSHVLEPVLSLSWDPREGNAA